MGPVCLLRKTSLDPKYPLQPTSICYGWKKSRCSRVSSFYGTKALSVERYPFNGQVDFIDTLKCHKDISNSCTSYSRTTGEKTSHLGENKLFNKFLVKTMVADRCKRRNALQL